MKHMLRLIAGLALIAAGLAYLLARDYQQVLAAPLPLQGEILFELPKGRFLDGLIIDLQARQLLQPARHRLYLRIYGRFNPEASRLKAGEYQLTPGMSSVDVIKLLVSGKSVLHELRLVEGLRFEEALKLVQENSVLEHTLPSNVTAFEVMAALDHPEDHPEGRFFPDTYLFPRGTTDVAFLHRAYSAGQKALEEEWARRAPALPYDTPYQALIMASIVERETGVSAERAEIAGVFVRRLQKGMRLQTDPSVIYGLGSAFDGNLRRKDLLTDTPYNSYTRSGLPPTPICLPGRAALQAALNPAAGEALYFVARGDGSHQFSATLQEHVAAVRRYQLGIKP
jgi:UPF0755 protein